jgi:hypothetical protein
MLKASLKTASINHTISGAMLSTIMTNTLVLGDDATHPTGSSFFGCPFYCSNRDNHAGRFLGSMRLQNVGKKEVSLAIVYTGRVFTDSAR